jgi:hypothetical protein
MVAGVPGLVMLQRFVPWGARDVEFRVADAPTAPPLGRGGLALRGLIATLGAFALSILALGWLAAAKEWRAGHPGEVLALSAAVLQPSGVAEAVTLFGAAAFAGGCGLTAAAATLARRRTS